MVFVTVADAELACSNEPDAHSSTRPGTTLSKLAWSAVFFASACCRQTGSHFLLAASARSLSGRPRCSDHRRRRSASTAGAFAGVSSNHDRVGFGIAHVAVEERRKVLEVVEGDPVEIRGADRRPAVVDQRRLRVQVVVDERGM